MDDKKSRDGRKKRLHKKLILLAVETCLLLILGSMAVWKSIPQIRSFAVEHFSVLSSKTESSERRESVEEEKTEPSADRLSSSSSSSILNTVSEAVSEAMQEEVVAEVTPEATPEPTPEPVDPRADGIQVGISWCEDFNEDGSMTQTQTLFYDAVLEAGGEPIFLPLVTDLQSALAVLDTVDCLIMTGGGDINPIIYGEEANNSYQHNFSEKRDYSDYWMISAAFQKNMPTLAICRGMQMMNIVMGGTLIQDIPSELDSPVLHQDPTLKGAVYHWIIIEEDTSLAAMIGSGNLHVNSYHHQCIGTLADGLRVSARAEDGVIEGIEATAYKFMVGVQFHPEVALALEDELYLSLFTGLIGAV